MRDTWLALRNVDWLNQLMASLPLSSAQSFIVNFSTTRMWRAVNHCAGTLLFNLILHCVQFLDLYIEDQVSFFMFILVMT